ncbi:MAG: hypothetical protein ACRDBG_23015, partial [Waterburya sp.]
TRTYIGASALFNSVSIRSGGAFAAEPVTLLLDGNKLNQGGLPSSLEFFNSILASNTTQKRINLKLAIRDYNTEAVNVVWNLYAGKINYIRQVDEGASVTGDTPANSYLECVLDSLAMRYDRATMRTRSHEDQLEIDSTDMFFSFVQSANATERSVYWGRAAADGSTGYSTRSGYTGGGSNTRGGGRYTGAYSYD